jgi:hypothetical protein
MVVAIPAQADEIMLVAVNSQTTQAVELQAQVCTMATTTNINNSDGSAGAWSALAEWANNNGTANIGQIAASLSSVRPRWIVSNPISISTVDRTDGGPGALLGIRYFMRTNIPSYTVFGNGGSDNLLNWATKPDGRIKICRSQIGNHVGTTSGFTSTTNESQSPVIGVIFLARGRVLTVARFGDSIMDGRGTYLGEGYMDPAAIQLQASTGVVVSDANFAWAGAPSAQYMQTAIDALATFGPYIDVGVVAAGSPNDVASTINAGIISGIRRNFGRVLDAFVDARVRAVVATWAPSNTAIKNYGATDSLRRAWNEQVRQASRTGEYDLVDTDLIWSGATDGAGQVQMAVGSTDDNIHPNNAGNALAVPAAVSAITPLALP